MAATTALTARNHFLFWGVAFAAFIGTVWALGDVLLPFVLGLAIAYLLNPLVELLGRHKIPRWIAALLILGLFLVFLATVVALALPTIYREGAALIEALPGYIDELWARIAPYIGWAREKLNTGDGPSLQDAVRNNIGNALKVGTGLLSGLASGGKAFIGFVSVLVTTPIVAFFVMAEWAKMTEWIDKLRASRNEILSDTMLLDSARHGIAEGLLAGITTYADTCASGVVLPAMLEMGVRGIMYQEVFGPAPERRLARSPLPWRTHDPRS